MITTTQNLKVINYDYFLIQQLQLQLLKIIMCFSIAMTYIPKHIDRIIIMLISITISI